MSLPVKTLDTTFGRCGLIAVDAAADIDPSAALRVDLISARDTLHPDERVAADALGRARRRDWIAGRAALRALLAAALSEPPPPVIPNERGAPVLPPGWVGSISHKRGLAAALIAPDEGWTVGIDVELATVPKRDLANKVLTPDERTALKTLSDDDRGRRVIQTFAIKEAIYKAIDPVVQRFVGFHEVEVAIGDNGTCAVRRVDPAAIPLEIEAEWRDHAGLWLCTARARRP